jgi:type IV pilus assembly protein PilF
LNQVLRSKGPLRAFAALALCCLSCGSTQRDPEAPPPRSSAAQSVAEYDVAVDLWLKRNEPRQALERALQATELDEDNAAASHLVALLYLDFCQRDEKECRIAQAEHFARAALDADEHFREAKNTLGVILIHQKRYPEAIAILRPLSQDILYQTPENAWGNLGWALLEAGQVEQAIEALLRSTAVQPAFCVGHYRLGLAYEAKRDLNAALNAYTRALEVDHPRCKELQEAYAARGRVAIQLGRQDEAVSDFEQCVHLAKSTKTGRECTAQLASPQ